MANGFPAALLQAVAAAGGGKLALVLGAGCSFEAPTNMPLAGSASREMYRQLVEDGVLADGDCANQGDLSCVADAVFLKTNSQADLVDRFCNTWNPKLAPPNEGYEIAAAMLMERAIVAVVTLNFDLAISSALSRLGAGNVVGVVESPQQIGNQKTCNVYYLHRCANASAEEWVLRTAPMAEEWKDQWEQIIATRVLSTPVVAFAGLGTPVAVLMETVKLIRKAMPVGTKVFQADPVAHTQSAFFQELAIGSGDYVQMGWIEFMRALSARLVTEHTHALKTAIDDKILEDGIAEEDVGSLLQALRQLGLVNTGRLRSEWLNATSTYLPSSSAINGLFADLLLAIAMIERVSAGNAKLSPDGLVRFCRDQRAVATYVIASGSGHRSVASLEARLRSRHKNKSNGISVQGAIIAGTSDTPQSSSPPEDVLRGDQSRTDIVDAPASFRIFHVADLRTKPVVVREVVP